MLAADDWIYITEDTHRHCWDLVPVLFSTRQEAEKHAKMWRKKGKSKERFVQVVEYPDDSMV